MSARKRRSGPHPRIAASQPAAKTRRDKIDKLDDLPPGQQPRRGVMDTNFDEWELDAEDRAALARLTPQQRVELLQFSEDLYQALMRARADRDPGGTDDLPEDPGLPETYDGTLVMGRRRKKR